MYSASLPIFDYGGDGDGGGDGDDEERSEYERVVEEEEEERGASAVAGRSGGGVKSSSAVAWSQQKNGDENHGVAPAATTGRAAATTDHDDDDVAAAPAAMRSAAAEAIEPPEEVQDLVSRAQWQWALGESEKASPTRGTLEGGGSDRESRLGGDFSTTNQKPPATAAKAPLKRPQIRPKRVAPQPAPRKDDDSRGGGVKLPPGLHKNAAAPKLPPTVAAKTALAEAQIAERREKLHVVERLMSAGEGRGGQVHVCLYTLPFMCVCLFPLRCFFASTHLKAASPERRL